MTDRESVIKKKKKKRRNKQKVVDRVGGKRERVAGCPGTRCDMKWADFGGRQLLTDSAEHERTTDEEDGQEDDVRKTMNDEK